MLLLLLLLLLHSFMLGAAVFNVTATDVCLGLPAFATVPRPAIIIFISGLTGSSSAACVMSV